MMTATQGSTLLTGAGIAVFLVAMTLMPRMRWDQAAAVGPVAPAA